MSKTPPIPPGERSTKGPGSDPTSGKGPKDKHAEPGHVAEVGETGNIAQNTKNKGFFAGRRVK